jgi:tetrahydromethanopterin S-methyltransferase subunit D
LGGWRVGGRKEEGMPWVCFLGGVGGLFGGGGDELLLE